MGGPTAQPPRRMSAPPSPPLTHHQILALVAPFTRSGRTVDLAASDRLARTLRFRPRTIEVVDGLAADTAERIGPLTETLQLECHASGSHRLGMWMVLHDVPIALLALSFTLQELARFELPPLPRRLRQAPWRQGGAGAAGSA